MMSPDKRNPKRERDEKKKKGIERSTDTLEGEKITKRGKEGDIKLVEIPDNYTHNNLTPPCLIQYIQPAESNPS